MSEIEEILVELKLMKEIDNKTGRNNLDGVLNFCKDINNETSGES